MTQKQIILKYLATQSGQWVKAYDLRGKPTPYGFTGHQADRRARELAEEGQIEHRMNGKYAEYRAKNMTEFLNNFPPAKVEIKARTSGVGSLFLV